MTGSVIGILVAGLLVAAWRSWITVKIKAVSVMNDQRLEINIRVLWGLVRWKRVIDKVDYKGLLGGIEMEIYDGFGDEDPTHHEVKTEQLNKDDVHRWRRFYEKLKRAVQGLGPWFLQTARHIHCTQLVWHTHVGVGEAAGSAIFSGMIWAIKSTMLGLLSGLVQFPKNPQLHVIPCFNQTYFATRAECILKMRLGHAIIAGILFIARFMKLKGGDRSWKNILSKV